eukprot:scaffold57754_cov17-Prasinocladus_malaysianus.AAC.1
MAARCFARLLCTNEFGELDKKKRNALQPIDQPPTAEHIHVDAVCRRQLSHKADNDTSFPRSSLMQPSLFDSAAVASLEVFVSLVNLLSSYYAIEANVCCVAVGPVVPNRRLVGVILSALVASFHHAAREAAG